MTGAGLTVLGLRTGLLAVLGLKTGLTVLAGLGGDAVLARLDGLERLTVGAVGRWLAHEHFPQGFFGYTGPGGTWSGYRDSPTAAPGRTPHHP